MDIRKAERSARQLIDKHELKGWRFRFDNAKRRFGYCDQYRQVISLSSVLVRLNSEKEVLNTILHEVAHALAGRGNGHNRFWKEQARAIGCEPSRCYSPSVITPDLKYNGHCPNCDIKIKRMRKPHANLACSNCCKGQWHEKYVFVWDK